MRERTERDLEYHRNYANRRYAEDPEYRKRAKESALRYYNEHKDDKEWKMHRCSIAHKSYIKRKLKQNDNQYLPINKNKTIMNYPISQKCIIRTNRAGVFFATLADFDATNRIATLNDCRRLWYWSGAASLSQLAVEGVKDPVACKFTIIVPEMQVMEVIEIIPCTDAAVKNIENVRTWKK